LGLWLYYYAKLERRFAIVLYTNMAVSSLEWKPRTDHRQEPIKMREQLGLLYNKWLLTPLITIKGASHGDQQKESSGRATGSLEEVVGIHTIKLELFPYRWLDFLCFSPRYKLFFPLQQFYALVPHVLLLQGLFSIFKDVHASVIFTDQLLIESICHFLTGIFEERI